MRLRWLIVVLVLGLMASCAHSTSANPFPPCTPHSFTSPGKRLPDCTFEGFNGSPTLRLSSLRGVPTVINFWASWCINCISEMPGFQSVHALLGDRVRFIGMNVTGLQGETKGAGRAFARQAGVHYQLAFDPNGLLYAHFSPSVIRPIMPITVFVGSNGIVRERNFGPLDPKELRADIKKYFGIT